MVFPILIINNNWAETVENNDLFTTTNTLGLKKGILYKNEIIDSTGKVFFVTNVTKDSNVNPFWKFEFFNPVIKVKIKLIQSDKIITTEELKQRLIIILKKNKDFWDSDGLFNKRLEIIIQADNYSKIILSLSSL